MASIFDVAAYILQKENYLSTMKLQKLAFYSQAYSLSVSDVALFTEDFEAWINGPVCKELFNRHRGKFVVGLNDCGFTDYEVKLKPAEKNIVDKVLDVLGNLTGADLSQLTHSEDPWRNARAGLPPVVYSDTVITKRAIRDFYSSSAASSNPLFA